MLFYIYMSSIQNERNGISSIKRYTNDILTFTKQLEQARTQTFLEGVQILFGEGLVAPNCVQGGKAPRKQKRNRKNEG
jgi:hypothetical protein